MNRRYLHQPIGWGLVAASVLVVFTTLRGKHGMGPLLPQLMPVFGIAFAVVATLALAAFCMWQRSTVNLVLVAAIFVAGFLLGYVGEHFGRQRPQPTPAIEEVLNQHGIYRLNYDWTRHRFVCAWGLASLVLGIKLLKDSDAL